MNHFLFRFFSCGIILGFVSGCNEHSNQNFVASNPSVESAATTNPSPQSTQASSTPVGDEKTAANAISTATPAATQGSNNDNSSLKDACISDLVSKLKIDVNATSNPALFNEILTKDMMLGDDETAKALFATELQKSIELRPMLEDMAKGIVTLQPAIHEYVCSLVKTNLIPEITAERKDLVTKTLHHTYLLNALTKKMSEDIVFSEKIIKALLTKREKELGIKSGIYNTAIDSYKISHDPFTPAKLLAVDWTYFDMRKNIEKNKIDFTYPPLIKGQLILNISEAVITEYARGFKDNAIAGLGLAINPPENTSLSKEKQLIEFGQSQEWVSLYTTWNLAFITGTLPNMNILYPKLIMPEIVLTKPSEFLYKRAISLWLSINFSLKGRLNYGDQYIPNSKEMSLLWGEINRKYAVKYIQQKNPFELKTISDYAHIPLDKAKELFSANLPKP